MRTLQGNWLSMYLLFCFKTYWYVYIACLLTICRLFLGQRDAFNRLKRMNASTYVQHVYHYSDVGLHVFVKSGNIG